MEVFFYTTGKGFQFYKNRSAEHHTVLYGMMSAKWFARIFWGMKEKCNIRNPCTVPVSRYRLMSGRILSIINENVKEESV